jgi:putative intracellular protease/amidase
VGTPIDKYAVYLLLQNGYADWEPATAVAELRRTFGYKVKTVGLDTEPIMSMGGLRLSPDLPLSEYAPDESAILILPGSDSWMAGEIPAVSKAIQSTIARGRPVAGICAATLAVAHCGLLDDRQHTSNGKDFIGKFVPFYRGQAFYQQKPAVRDRLVITANGLSPFPFAAEIFRALVPEREEEIKLYEQLYSRGLLD